MNNLTDGFKETEIGPVPVDWEVVPFEGTILKKRIKVGKVKKQDYKPSGKFPVVDQGQEFIAGYWDESDVVYDEDLPVIIFGDHTRIFKFVDFPFVVGADGVKVLLPNRDRCDSRFLYFACTNLEIPSKGYNRHYRLLREQVLPLPPLPEQRRIAHVLSTIQRAIAAQDDLIAAARETKRSLMQRLFTYGPGPEPAPTKETESGEIPEQWEVTQLGKIAEKPQYGYTASASEEPIGPQFLRITDIQDSRVQWDSVPYCEIDKNKMEKYRLKQGDILIARIGATTGKTCLITECPNSVFASYLIRVRAKPEFVTFEYLHYFTNTEIYWTQINASKGGRLKQGVNIPILTSLVVPLPPLSEQYEIARILNAVDGKIQAGRQRKAALQALFHSTLHQLMTGQIRLKENLR